MLVNNETSETSNYYNYDLTFISQRFLMNTPVTIFIIWISYLLFTVKLGPEFMKKRPAYKLTIILMVYNVAQVVLTSYIVYMGLPILWKYGLKPNCLYNKDDSIGYLKIIHIYFLCKPVELLDTAFFILRKKYNQVSFLHVYHHCYMLISTWLIVRYDPTYSLLFPAVLNSFVHVIMYTYYGLSAFPTLVKYLWWKKYITTMQLVQFVMIICHLLRCYHTSDCPPSFIMAYSMTMNCLLFIILFSNFYIKSYWSPRKSAPHQ